MAAPVRIILRRRPFSKTPFRTAREPLGNLHRVEVLVVFPIGEGPIKDVCRYSSRRKIALHILKNILCAFNTDLKPLSHYLASSLSRPPRESEICREPKGAELGRELLKAS